jgi:hypothetical protein
MQQARRDEALATCRRGLGLFPDDVELRFCEGVLLQELGHPAEAERAYLDVLNNHEERHFSSVDRALKGFKTRQNLAVLYSTTWARSISACAVTGTRRGLAGNRSGSVPTPPSRTCT